MDYIRDRGNIKWTAMMLPEQRKMLRELESVGQNQEKPELTEEKMEEINQLVSQAIAQQQDVTLKYYQNLRTVEVTGKIKQYYSINRQLIVQENDEIHYISLDSIIDALPVNFIGWE